MKRFSIILIISLSLILGGCAEVLNQLNKLDSVSTPDRLSSSEIIKGLKEALVVGAAN